MNQECKIKKNLGIETSKVYAETTNSLNICVQTGEINIYCVCFFTLELLCSVTRPANLEQPLERTN